MSGSHSSMRCRDLAPAAFVHQQQHIPAPARHAPLPRRGVARHASPEEHPEHVLWQQRRQLESMLKMSDPTAEEDAQLDAAPLPPDSPSLISNLPLWRIQTTVLPGAQSVLHVHVPHYTHMFEQLMAGPRPWRFGHIYLPGGSANLGSPEYELRPGTSAPLVGTLMMVLSSLWTKDGRLLLLAVGVARIRVVAARQAVPYSRADVALLPDSEEAAACTDAAMRAVDACARSEHADMAAVMRAVAAAAGAAAAASGQGYELAPLRALVREEDVSNVVPGEAGRGADGMFAPPRLLWRSIVASMQGLRLGGGAPALGQDQFAALPLAHLQPPGSMARRVAHAALAEAQASADEAAFAAAMEAARARLADSSAARPAADEPVRLNSTRERGIASEGASEATLEEVEAARRASAAPGAASSQQQQQQAPPPEVAEALLLERLVWQALDAITVLAARARKVVPEVLLSPSLLALRPPGDPAPEGAPAATSVQAGSEAAGASGGEQGAAAGAEDGSQAGSGEGPAREEDAEYPAVRRAQRLSYALATALQHAFSHADGRQAVLETASTAARLQLLLEALVRQRNTLQALAALRMAEEG